MNCLIYKTTKELKLEDLELLEAARKGDKDAFKELIMKYEQKVSKATILRVMVLYFYENQKHLKSLLDELKGKDKIKYIQVKIK